MEIEEEEFDALIRYVSSFLDAVKVCRPYLLAVWLSLDATS